MDTFLSYRHPLEPQCSEKRGSTVVQVYSHVHTTCYTTATALGRVFMQSVQQIFGMRVNLIIKLQQLMLSSTYSILMHQ